MILYDPVFEKNFSELGIPIEKRAYRCYRELSEKYGSRFFLQFEKPLICLGSEDYERAHSKEYVSKIFSGDIVDEIYRAYELEKYGREEMDLDAFGRKILAQVEMSAAAMQLALGCQWTYFLGGGMHHAHHGYGGGFCLVNDIIIGLRKLQADKKIQKAWVVDLDAHKGDGTAAIVAGDESIKTLSIHMAHGWPIEKGDLYSSDIDIPIGEGQEDGYLQRLQQGLEQIDDCDLVVVVDGSDPYQADALPSTSLLRLSKEQMLERNLLVYNHFEKKGISQCYLIGGGYGDHAWEIHYQFLDYLLQKKK